MNILQLIEQSHTLSKKKGFWDVEKNPQEDLMLIVANLGDVIKAFKKKKHANWTLLTNHSQEKINIVGNSYFEAYIKDSFEDELANVVLRITDFIGGFKIDITKTHPWLEEYLHKDLNLFFITSAPSERYSGNMGEWLSKSVNEWTYNRNEKDYGCSHMLFYLGSIIEHFKIDIERHIKAKLEYNKTRPKLYGRSY